MVGDKIKLIKLSEAPNPLYPDHIKTGAIVIGEQLEEVKIGEGFVLYLGKYSVYRTSVVQEILDKNTFRTFNSIYRIELIPEII